MDVHIYNTFLSGIYYWSLHPIMKSQKHKGLSPKAELPQEGISFRTQFSSLGIFINKKVRFQKNQGLVYNF
jgi:hypothetical protein